MIYTNPNIRASSRDGYVIATFIADTVAELPPLNYLTDYTLEIGSTCHVIEDSGDYEMQSNGTWVKRIPAVLANTYTRTEIDSKIATVNSDIDILAGLQDTDRQIIIDMINSGAKNILFFDGVGTSAANSGTSYTSNGITFEIQNDGTIRVHGTITSGTSYCYLYTGTGRTNIISGFDGEHVLSGNPYGASVDSFRLWYKVGSQPSISEPTNGTTLPAQTGETSAVLGLQVNAPQTDLDVLFSPMITPKFIYDATPDYRPYCPTLQQLYAMVQSYHGGV